MANATVEKLKTLGIRHGEKAGVAVVAALCLLMLWLAFTHRSIEMTPDQVEKAAQAAQQNLNKDQDDEAILAKIEAEGIVQPHFEQIVDNRKPGGADPSKYALANLPIAPEPGAGLLRQAPTLIAVNDLRAHPGRGAIQVYETEDDGTIKLVDATKEDTSKSKSKRRNRNRGGMAMGMGMPGGEMGIGGGGSEPTQKQKDEQEKARREREKALQKSLTGRPGQPKAEPEKKKDIPAGMVESEVIKGFRWVALTAVLDHERLRDNYAKALKVDLAGAHPHYLRVDVERQSRQDDGSWSEWAAVDRDAIDKAVFDVLTEKDPETSPLNDQPMLPDDVKLAPITDPLPFLEVGYWVGVHPMELVSAEALKAPETKPAGGMAGLGEGMMGPGGMPGMGGAMGRGMGGMGRGMGGMPGMPGGMGEGGMGMLGEPGEGMSMFGSAFGGASIGGDTNFEKTEAEKVMVRFLDFTVEPDSIYRYRVRLVVKNPNLKIQSVEPGVDTTSEELPGPWCDPSDTVVVPPDVAAYVVDYAPSAVNQRRDDLVQFEMVRWDPASGVTVAKQMPAAPGQVIGEPMSAAVPDLDNQKQKSAQVDFTSHRVLVDTSGGQRAVDKLNIGPPRFDAPALALMLRPDGTLVLRDEAGDATDGEMKDMVAIYRQTLEDTKENKQKESSLLGGYGGMMMGGPGGR